MSMFVTACSNVCPCLGARMNLLVVVATADTSSALATPLAYCVVLTVTRDHSSRMSSLLWGGGVRVQLE